MKKALTAIILTCFTIYYSWGGNPFFSTTEGLRAEYVKLDKKGAVQGYTVNTVSKVTRDGDVTIVETLVENLDKDRKPSKKSSPFTIVVHVSENEAIMQKETMMPKFELKKGQSMTVGGDNPVYPVNAGAGEVLPAYTLAYSIVKEGKITEVATYSCSGREIVGFTEVETPAGTFKCLELTEKVDLTILTGKKITRSSTGWYSPGVGLVKREEYSGKMVSEGVTQLLSVSK